jgi:hypothetical protein
MKKAKEYEIINHGPEHSQYFQGCGVSYTKFDTCVTGIGDNAKDAYNDAVEQIYEMGEYTEKSLDNLLPKRPKGIRVKDRLTKEERESDEFYWHLSIRVRGE